MYPGFQTGSDSGLVNGRMSQQPHAAKAKPPRPILFRTISPFVKPKNLEIKAIDPTFEFTQLESPTRLDNFTRLVQISPG
jgi:hypothetical protein